MPENEQPEQENAASTDAVVSTDKEQAVAGIIAGEADPHGATVVAAVGNEDGVQAVMAIDTDYFNTVLAAEFADPDAAKAAYMALLEAEINGSLHIDGVLAVHADDAGKIHIDKLTEHSTKKGVKWGAAAGLVLGVLFPPAIIASTVAWGVVGGALGKMRNLHHRNQVADQLAGADRPEQLGHPGAGPRRRGRSGQTVHP